MILRHLTLKPQNCALKLKKSRLSPHGSVLVISVPRLVRRLRHHRLLRDGVAEERGSHPGATAAGSDVTSGRVVRGLVGGVAFLFFGADKDLRDGGVWIGGGVVGLEEGGECMGGNELAEYEDSWNFGTFFIQ